jgi:diguanylate cyclase (GGDEF)-like protein
MGEAMAGMKTLRKRFQVPTALGSPLIAKFIASMAILILPVAIVRYIVLGEYLLSAYYILLVVLIAVDLRAYLKWQRVPINPTLLLIAVQVGVFELIAHHGASASVWLFPLTVAGFFYSSLSVAQGIGFLVSLLGGGLIYHVTGDVLFAFRFVLALATVVVFMRFMLRTMKRLEDDLGDAVERDPLTGCHNRRAFMRRLEEGRFGGASGSLLFIDIDHFKEVNDSFGHVVGDQVLRMMVEGMSEVLRRQEYLYRMGGEEFAVLLPNVPVELAVRVGERLRRHLAEKVLPKDIRLTISVGVESYSSPDEIEQTLTRADANLYRAKQAGRNTVMHPGSIGD